MMMVGWMMRQGQGLKSPREAGVSHALGVSVHWVNLERWFRAGLGVGQTRKPWGTPDAVDKGARVTVTVPGREIRS